MLIVKLVKYFKKLFMKLNVIKIKGLKLFVISILNKLPIYICIKKSLKYKLTLKDYKKVCLDTDRILLENKYNLDVLSNNFLSPIRADLYKNYLQGLYLYKPYIFFVISKFFKLSYIIIQNINLIFKSFINSIFRKDNKQSFEYFPKEDKTETLILSHADKLSQFYNDYDLYYGKRSLHKANYCILNKTGIYSKLITSLNNNIYIVEMNNLRISYSFKVYKRMIKSFFLVLLYFLKNPFSRFNLCLLVDSLSLTTFTNFCISMQIEEIILKNSFKNVITTWEGYPWERHIAYYCNNNKINLYAYIHAGPFSTQHAAYRKLPNQFNPIRFLTPTKISQNLLKKYHFLESTLVGTHKFCSINSNFKNGLFNNTTADKSRKLLLLPQGTRQEVYEFCKLAFSAYLKDIEIIVRLHPVFSKNKKISQKINYLINKSTRPDLISLSNETLEFDIKRSSHFLFRGSTSAIEAGCFGLTPVYFISSDELDMNLNSLDGINIPKSLQINNSNELENIFSNNITFDISKTLKNIYLKPIEFDSVM